MKQGFGNLLGALFRLDDVSPRKAAPVNALCPILACLGPFSPTSSPCLVLTLTHAPSQRWSRCYEHLSLSMSA